MLQVELKKILFHHKGLLLLLIALAAYAVFCVGSGYDSSYVIDRNEDTYLTYMERWQGEITEEKAQEMEAEYAEATRSDDGRKAAFLTIYNQYYYAKEDPAHRFLMDERGWDTLLTRDGVNVILLLFLLALCVPVFCGEYQCGMAQILRSCRNGRGRLAGIKLCVMAALAVLATVLFQLVQFVVVALSVGLDGASYPLQSLSFFEHSPYLISVGQAYGIVVLSRCLGAAWFAILIALLSILFRQTVLTTFSGIAVSILPHLIGGSFLKYVLPLPAGLLAGTGYVWGTLTEVGYDEDWNLIDIVTFPGITPEQFGYTRCSKEDLAGGTPAENAEITKAIVNGTEKGPKRQAVCMNAGAAFYIAGKAKTIEDGVKMAENLIDSGAAAAKLAEFIKLSNEI